MWCRNTIHLTDLYWTDITTAVSNGNNQAGRDVPNAKRLVGGTLRNYVYSCLNTYRVQMYFCLRDPTSNQKGRSHTRPLKPSLISPKIQSKNQMPARACELTTHCNIIDAVYQYCRDYLNACSTPEMFQWVLAVNKSRLPSCVVREEHKSFDVSDELVQQLKRIGNQRPWVQPCGRIHGRPGPTSFDLVSILQSLAGTQWLSDNCTLLFCQRLVFMYK